MNQEIEEVFTLLMSDPNLDFGDYMALVLKVMELAGRYPNLDGPDKKEVVVSVVSIYVEHSNDELLKTILSETTVKNLIEVIYTAYSHRVTIKRSFNKIRKYCC